MVSATTGSVPTAVLKQASLEISRMFTNIPVPVVPNWQGNAGAAVNAEATSNEPGKVQVSCSARRIYNRQWWMTFGYSEIENQWIATKQFDLSVNLGPFQAHLITQRALRSVGVKVATDGIFGPVTKGAINCLSNKPGLIAAMRSEAAGVYRLIVVKKPALAEFLTGWLNRAYQ